MNKIEIKPISVNDCWRGRRFKTPEYEVYEKELFYKLKKQKVPTGKIFLRITAGISSKNADLDNIVKPFVDVLQKRLGFNDRQIYGMDLWKEDVKKGQEYIEFEIQDLST